MTVENLINLLEDLAEAHPEAEVRFMSQPNWPFEYSIRGVTTTSEISDDEEEDEDEGVMPEAPTKTEVIYLVEGSKLGYGNKAAWDVCRSF